MKRWREKVPGMKRRISVPRGTGMLALAGSLLVTALVAEAQVVDEQPAGELSQIDVVERLGDTIPLDLSFTADDGSTVRLDEYFHRGKPVVLVLGYYECPMLCNLVYNGLTETIKGLSWVPGDRYELVMVSINPDEPPELAAAKKSMYVAHLGKPEAAQGWHFLVGTEEASRTLADAVGFKYFYDEERRQYAHPAVVFVLTEDGVISRYLYGIEFPVRDFKLALLEAGEGKIGNTVDRLILYCFQYDPEAKGYVIFAGNVMRLGGVVTVIFLVLLLGGLWRRERRRRRAALERVPVYRAGAGRSRHHG